ncbi:MAG: cupin domain-containing protein [Alphaproteobacteria bacterium]|nr:MAG: cupin domain-containing protein [Alphaproteobacteria bacterium]
MLETLRRVVTDQGPNGKSKVWLNGPAGKIMEEAGYGVGELWICKGQNPDLTGKEDTVLGDISLEPPKGGVTFRYFIVSPENKNMTAEERAELDAATAAAFEMAGAGHARVDTSRHPAMHKTATLDFIILLRGAVTLLLDEDEVDLKQGDVVVQRATNHAWINHGEDPALLVAVLIDASA